METEPTGSPAYLPATAPEWAAYYKRAKETRRLGKGQHARIQLETKLRRRRANLMILASTAALIAVIAAFCALLGTRSAAPSPEGDNAAPSRTADVRRG
ncbi:MAG TPA: hypothetical protein VH560_05900 [Polyangia bacterium]|nr:hypothetical protein [Polyangia bacterium]